MVLFVKEILTEKIEAALAEREKNLFNLDQTVFLYDLTSTYFEGRALANPKAKRGHSRDMRPDCKQVVVGLAVNRDGFPLAHEVLAGNRNDSTTVEEMLDSLNRRVGLRAGQTVVVDRGMSGEANLEKILRRGLHYLVAAQQGERAGWLEEFEEHEGFVEVKREPSPRRRWSSTGSFRSGPPCARTRRSTASGSWATCPSSSPTTAPMSGAIRSCSTWMAPAFRRPWPESHRITSRPQASDGAIPSIAGRR